MINFRLLGMLYLVQVSGGPQTERRCAFDVQFMGGAGSAREQRCMVKVW